MLRVFLVPEGVSLSEELPPTETVGKLQISLGRQCGVSNKDVIILTAKGHVMDPSDILGSHDGGTEEKPFYVYFRPGTTPHSSYIHMTYEKNTQLEMSFSRISSVPTSSSLQQHVTLAKEYVNESVHLSGLTNQFNTQCHLMWSGWRALLLNFTVMKKNFENHQRVLVTAVDNFKQSLESYKDLLERTPEQLEILKKIYLPSFMVQSVFEEQQQSLYDWINSQDEHSNLDDLYHECKLTLDQINESNLEELQGTAASVTGSSAKWLQKESTEVTVPQEKEMENIIREQNSICESLQVTVKRALASGDAVTLVNVCSSNCQLLKLMYNNHSKLENTVDALQTVKQSLKERINTGLKSLATLQQDMTDVNTKIQFQCGQLHLIRRRFEVLEQICATPYMMECILDEVKLRKSYKAYFIEEGEKIMEMFEEKRQKEKNRRQDFLKKCGHHFVVSLFPSFTDRLPRLINSVSRKFDEEICILPHEELDRILEVMPRNLNEFTNYTLVSSINQTHTHTTGTHPHITGTHTHTTGTHPYIPITVSNIGTQTVSDIVKQPTNSNVSTQTVTNIGVDRSTQIQLIMMETGTQATSHGQDIGTQVTSLGQDIGTQVTSHGQDIGTQVTSLGQDIGTQVTSLGQDIGTQVTSLGQDIGTQVTSLGQDIGTQVTSLGQDVSTQVCHVTNGIDKSSQINPEVTTSSIQTDVLYDTFNIEKIEMGIQVSVMAIEACTQMYNEMSSISTQTNDDQRWRVHQLNDDDDTGSGDNDLSLPAGGSVNGELQSQVVALQAAVEGLKSQLMTEREKYKREKDKLMKQSFQDNQEMSTSINTTNLKIGDYALFLPDARGNFLALTFDDRMYYLTHTAVDKFTTDISNRSIIPLRRKVYIGVITEKVLVEVRKETNRLQVPVGHRLYKVTAREIPLPLTKQY